MNDNLISIVMPAYNASRYLREAVASIRAQTFSNWELIIVDDCSDDETAEQSHAIALQDERISVVNLSSTQGSAGARNVGIKRCRGRYLTFLDADDLWLPERLARHLRFVHQRRAGFSFGAYQKLQGNTPGALIDVPDKISWRQLLNGSRINCCTVMLDRTEIPEPVFPEELGLQEDYALWLLLLRQGRLAYGFNESLVMYRLHGANKSGKKLKAAVAQWKVYRQYEGLSMPESIWHLGNYAVRGALKAML